MSICNIDYLQKQSKANYNPTDYSLVQRISDQIVDKYRPLLSQEQKLDVSRNYEKTPIYGAMTALGKHTKNIADLVKSYITEYTTLDSDFRYFAKGKRKKKSRNTPKKRREARTKSEQVKSVKKQIRDANGIISSELRNKAKNLGIPC